ncbi:CD109 antigen [Euwallacea similis]|uniref:CD109 antigen n=1 Tax=Euwallacea similis TaxID=1736056 RepID=UPI00345004B9
MKRKRPAIWAIFVCLSCLVDAQDVNQYNDPYNRYNPSGSPNDPYKPPSQYSNQPGQDQYGTIQPTNSLDSTDPYNRDRDRYGQDPYRNRDRNSQFDGDPFANQHGVYDYTPYRNPLVYGGSGSRVEHAAIIKEATYFVVASKMVRPGQLYRVSVTVLKEKQPLIVRASISRNGVEMSSDYKPVKEGILETLLMRVPTTSAAGEYKLRVEGLYEDILGGAAFSNETKLTFSERSMTNFIQLDKPVYKQGEIVRFRTIPINTELKAFSDAVDVYVKDPNGHIVKRWLSRQSNLGTVSLNYQLSDQPVFGEWRIRVEAQGQIEESTFLVEEYYQTRFEVNVTMPAFFLNTEPYISGIIMANYTNGAPVRGNLTLKASLRPVKPIDINKKLKKNRPRPIESNLYNPYGHNDFWKPEGAYHGPINDDLYRRQNYGGQYDPQRDPYQDNFIRNNPYDNYYDNYDPYDKPLVEKYYRFDEEFPSWMPRNDYWETIPSLKFFYGTYEFKFPISDLLESVQNLDGMEVLITATVGDRFLDEVIEGYSTARVFNSSVKLQFMGGSPQVFKPGMPVSAYLVTSFYDGSPLSQESLRSSYMEVSASVEKRGGGRLDIPPRRLWRMEDQQGVWQYHLDLKRELGIFGPKAFDELSLLSNLRIHATFRDDYTNQHATAELLMVAHYSNNDQHIKVTTSTTTPQVGEHMIFHIRSNYYIEKVNYLIIAKGIVLVTGDQDMDDFVSTMPIVLSAEMAPSATIVVWHVGRYGDLTVDSLTFPVNGISRNKFKVVINNKKARTGHKVEVVIYGEPGSYVGLSGVDRAFYTMQAGNELTYAKVITKMMTFDDHMNGSLMHAWMSHDGYPDELIYFPSSTFGIDANRTFEFAGLVVFSDFELTRKPNFCNSQEGMGECLNGRCYRLDKRCDYYNDCEDGTDEAGCNYENNTELALFRKFRFNRVQRQYDNVWVWEDVNIGPHGRSIININVPARPAHWMVSAFSMSHTLGFGMLNKAIEYVGVLPFFINVEMPTICMQGEQVGIRVTVFNYMEDNMEATVVLKGSQDYKFVHVEENGVVRAYNPRTSFGEHQFFIFIKAQDASQVYVPIVPTRLGDIYVTIYASTLIGKDEVTRKLHVEPDGLPQHRHQSVLLDLSNRAYTFQYMHVNITETPIIPYEYDRYYVYGSNKASISIVGDVVGPIFPTMPVNATSLLHLPMDSAEQNMFSFAANMYTLLYMRYTQQKNKTLQKLAFHYMNVGYQRQLSFLQPDGSFSTFRSDWNNSASSVWLTAYCARILQEASFYEWENYIYIDPVVISRAVEWVLRHQTEEGSFYETTWIPDRKYNASLNFDGRDHIAQRNITLTAHVLITLESVKDLTSGLSSKVNIATRKAISWLERNMDLIEDKGEAFDVAIVAYALMKNKAANAERAFLALSRKAIEEGGLVYFARQRIPQPPSKMENQRPFLLPRLPYEYDSENIEATAYALMVYVEKQELWVDSIVRWLNTQRLLDGGWSSTSDTANAMKALIEYTSAQRIRDISSLSVKVEATSLPGKSQLLYVNDKNRARLQHIEIPNAWGTVKVDARGTGYAILQMHVQYNVDIEKFQTQPPTRAFDLVTKQYFYGRNQSHITYVSCQRWTNFNESHRSGMAILDITVPTGYIVQQQDLDAYVISRRVRNLQRAKFEERKVYFYFDFLDSEDTCVNFTVERWYPVANMSRYLSARVYDYYAPERFNETLIDSLSTYVLDICQVCGSSQCPYCWIYNSATTTAVPFLTISTLTLAVLWLNFRLPQYFKNDFV